MRYGFLIIGLILFFSSKTSLCSGSLRTILSDGAHLDTTEIIRQCANKIDTCALSTRGLIDRLSVNPEKDGGYKITGYSDSNFQILEITTNSKGQKNGLYKSFHSNGAVYEEATFIDGMLNSSFIVFDDLERKVEEFIFKEPSSPQSPANFDYLSYHKSSKIGLVEVWRKGHLESASSFDLNGRLVSKVSYDHRGFPIKKIGTWDSLKYETIFKDGITEYNLFRGKKIIAKRFWESKLKRHVTYSYNEQGKIIAYEEVNNSNFLTQIRVSRGIFFMYRRNQSEETWFGLHLGNQRLPTPITYPTAYLITNNGKTKWGFQQNQDDSLIFFDLTETENIVLTMILEARDEYHKLGIIGSDELIDPTSTSKWWQVITNLQKENIKEKTKKECKNLGFAVYCDTSKEVSN